MRSIFLLSLSCCLVSSRFGSSWEDLEIPLRLIYDFTFIDNEKTILVVEALAGKNTSIVAVDVTGPEMRILATQRGFCSEVDGNSYDAENFIPINQTTVGLHCVYMTPDFIPWSLVYFLTWDPDTHTLHQSENFGNFKPGWRFSLPSPSYLSSLDTQRLWFWDPAVSAVSVRVSSVGIESLALEADQLVKPGIDWASSFVSPGTGDDAYVVLSQSIGNQSVLNKYKVSGWAKEQSTSFDQNCFALSGQTSAYLDVPVGARPGVARFAQCDFDAWKCGPSLNLTYPVYMAYPGNSGVPAAVFVGDLSYFVLDLDYNPFSFTNFLYQVKMLGLDEVPQLLDTIKVPSRFFRNVLATSSWLYIDTYVNANATYYLSRVAVSDAQAEKADEQ